ncbi:4,5-dihydroxyphthalate decarboxylase [Rhodococcus sp. 06-418-5]|uniref:4,5-dihydroxyphthalate decarboxylase n=1 Tax=Rhodococcus sp. 06-418-5 TaxID=2022507 RepID=UPI000B9AD42B|nr:4,5-dihydroxyphthalate decarboxylase [Rhodococcus sp. 06-418-5]OZC75015.1 4,5-dihydroxyphthalate decarboxylase [Rhodococcus sp. 06-418-5]
MTGLSVSTIEYDTTRALFDGTVPLPTGTTLSTRPTLPEVFRDVLTGQADIGEFGLTFLLRVLEQGSDLVALPVFPNRVFRHSCIFVHRGSGVIGPSDLVDRTIGEFGIYGQDSGVWAKGMLMDDYGFLPERNRWIIGGLDRSAPPFDFIPRPIPADLDLSAAPEGRSLSDMLVTGDLDALFTANVPQPFLDGSPDIVRLFPDYEERERDWFARTGLFPIMHAVVGRRLLFDENPGLARSVYNSYLSAKYVAAEAYRERNRLFEVHTMLPWANSLFERNQHLLGHDWWPYGIDANRHALDTNLRYHYEQGLTSRRWNLEELFLDELMDT